MADKKKKNDKRDDRDDQDFYVNVIKDALATKKERRNRWRGNKWEAENHAATSSYFYPF